MDLASDGVGRFKSLTMTESFWERHEAVEQFASRAPDHRLLALIARGVTSQREHVYPSLDVQVDSTPGRWRSVVSISIAWTSRYQW